MALSAFCLAVCVLLIAIWVRSYFKNSQARIYLGGQSDPDLWSADINSFKGKFNAVIRVRSGGMKFQPPRKLEIPYLWPVLLTIALAGLPWVRWSSRYSVRAFLIVVTLIALFLGIIASM